MLPRNATRQHPCDRQNAIVAGRPPGLPAFLSGVSFVRGVRPRPPYKTASQPKAGKHSGTDGIAYEGWHA
ncbi:MAG: hypothetical protein GF315_07520 [candidate division Zixibacteria bacterium]|nr:hypothetical protein [candidate division Zixibacteria bacterium]